MSLARHATHKHRARSSAGIKRSKIGFCSKFITYFAISRCRSALSSIITTTTAKTRALATSHPPTPTLGATQPSLKGEKDQETDHPGSPLEPSTPSGLTSNQDELNPPLENRLNSPKGFNDGQRFEFQYFIGNSKVLPRGLSRQHDCVW